MEVLETLQRTGTGDAGGHSGPDTRLPSFTQPPPDLPRALSIGVVWVPSEYLHIAAIDLPLKKHGQRLKAAPFAIESRLALPLETAHVALGPCTGQNTYVAATVDLDLINGWLSEIETRSSDLKMIVPDTFMVPRPEAGAWGIGQIGERVLVRMSDGAGFATHRNLFETFHVAAGSPPCHLAFGSSGGFPIASKPEMLAWPTRSELLDLRQGQFAIERTQGAKTRTRQMTYAALALGIFSTATAADTWVLSQARDVHRNALAAEFSARFPQTPAGPDIVQTVDALAAQASRKEARGLSGALSDAFLVLGSDSGLAVRELSFDVGIRQLELSAEAGSIDALQRAATRLNARGIGAEIGTANVIPGGAEGRLVLMAESAIP